MSLILLKRICPFCPRSTTFATNQKLREHISKNHDYILPSRSLKQQNKAGFKQFTKTLRQQHPHAPIKLVCPSCLSLYSTKPSLEKHLKEHVDSFSQLTTFSEEAWIVEGDDILQLFDEYKAHCLRKKNNYKHLDSHFKELLAMSSILVLQRRHDYVEVLNDFINAPVLDKAYREMKDMLSFDRSMNPTLAASIKDVLKGIKDNKVGNTDGRISLLNLVKDATGIERNVVLAVESILPIIKDLNIEQRSENDLSAAFIHPIMQALFSLKTTNCVAHCANTTVNDIEDINKRPDYVVDIYQHYRYAYTTCYGEIKNDSVTNMDRVMNFYRLCLFTKGGIEMHNLNKVLCFQAVGFDVTFYAMIRPYPKVNTIIELATINIPAVKNDLLDFMSILDTLLSVATLHHSLKPNSESCKPVPLPTLPFEFLQTTNTTLPRKRKSSLSTLS